MDALAEGLLHISAVAFAMCAAYLGLDRLDEQGRTKADKKLKRQVAEAAKCLDNDKFIKSDGVNELSSYVGDYATRKAICKLCALTNRQHDLYKGLWGRFYSAQHQLHLLVCYRAYLRHYDIHAIGIMGIVSFGMLLYLSWVSTFDVPLSERLAEYLFWTCVIIVVLVAFLVQDIGRAVPRLSRLTSDSLEIYKVWFAGLGKKAREAAEESLQPDINPPTNGQH